MSTLYDVDSHHNKNAYALPRPRSGHAILDAAGGPNWPADAGDGNIDITDSFSTSETPLPHKARSFSGLPTPYQVPLLLAELATAACPFSPALADVPLALYGAGNLGRLARDYLKTVGRDFEFAVDRNPPRIESDPEWSIVPLVHPDDVTTTNKRGVRLAVTIVTSPYVPIERWLLENGFTDVVPFYDLAESFRRSHPLSNGWFAPPLTANDQDNTAKVLALWDDDASRAHHLQFLAWRRLREEWTFEPAPPLPNSSRFFIPEVVSILHDHEVLLDAGAYDGGVIETFVQRTAGAFQQIVAIEPDPLNRARLEDRLQSLLPNDCRVTVYDCALGEQDGKTPFHSGLGYASQLSDTGQMQVAVCRLDALGLSPTFVKLHLEGAELSALKGARQMLVASRPVIAATVYHNDDGIWKTARWLMETLADYRFLFRVHSWCGTGAVIYAIPRERAA